MTPFGMHLRKCNVRRTWDECKELADYANKKKLADDYNRCNCHYFQVTKSYTRSLTGKTASANAESIWFQPNLVSVSVWSLWTRWVWHLCFTPQNFFLGVSSSAHLHWRNSVDISWRYGNGPGLTHKNIAGMLFCPSSNAFPCADRCSVSTNSDGTYSH